MATTLLKLFSQVQSDIGDEAFERVQRGEYLDFARDIADSIGSVCRIWTNSIEVTPIPQIDYTYALDTDRTSASGFVVGDIGKIAYVTETAKYWTLTVDSPPAWVELNPYVAIIPASERVQSLLLVRRESIEAQEYSFQAVSTWPASGYAFPLNSTGFDSREFNAIRQDDESIHLWFSEIFTVGESITAIVLTQSSWAFQKWTEATSIPDFVMPTMATGVLSRVTRRMFMRGDEKAEKKMAFATAEYDKELRALRVLTRTFVDERSVVVAQPLRWLGEGTGGFNG